MILLGEIIFEISKRSACLARVIFDRRGFQLVNQHLNGNAVG